MENGAINNSSKYKIIGLIALFALIWNFLVIRFLISWDTFKTMNPVIQYFLYNVGFVALSIVTIGIIWSFLRKQQLDLKTALIEGTLSFVLFSFLIYGTVQIYDTQGKINNTQEKSISGIHADGMLGYVLIYFFPSLENISIPIINVSFLYVAIYILVPVVWTILIAVALTRGEFIMWAKTGIGVKA